jgi:1-acyl-sn-glycerol-3-phosphate acyltransferase
VSTFLGLLLAVASAARSQAFLAPALDAAVSAPAAPVPALAAPIAAPSLAFNSLAAPSVAAPLAATAALAPLASPVAPAAAPAAPALPALSAAAALPAAPPRASAESLRSSAAAAFGEAAARPTADESPVAAPESGGAANGPRLAPLLASRVNAFAPPAVRAPRPEPKPFFVRHYRLARAVALPIVHFLYGIDVSGKEFLPEGPAILAPNHVTYMDPVLISFAANRPMRFLMYRGLYETPGLEWLFRGLGAIPISSRDPKSVTAEALERARRALAQGETVVIFPEGMLTRTGALTVFRRGLERIAEGGDAPVIPVAVTGMWGSAFSRNPSSSLWRSLLNRLRGRRRVAVRFGPALPRAEAGVAQDAVARLLADQK